MRRNRLHIGNRTGRRYVNESVILRPISSGDDWAGGSNYTLVNDVYLSPQTPADATGAVGLAITDDGVEAIWRFGNLNNGPGIFNKITIYVRTGSFFVTDGQVNTLRIAGVDYDMGQLTVDWMNNPINGKWPASLFSSDSSTNLSYGCMPNTGNAKDTNILCVYIELSTYVG